MHDIADERLIGLFAETGEIRHFNELVGRHMGRVRAMIYPMVLNDADADDLTQDVFMSVVRNISRFRGKAQFTTWLYRIAMNTAHSFLSKKGRHSAEDGDSLPDYPDKAPGPAREAAIREWDSCVQKALASLSPPLRSAIVLTAINGMDVQDAARAEGCLMATMYWRVHQARKILKSKLGELIR